MKPRLLRFYFLALCLAISERFRTVGELHKGYFGLKILINY
jgi:hypothetical protein